VLSKRSKRIVGEQDKKIGDEVMKNIKQFASVPLSYGTGLAQWYSAGLLVGWSGVRVPAAAGSFSLHRRVRTGSGAHPDSCPVGAGGFFPGGGAAGA
jgi:hypothetical protein